MMKEEINSHHTPFFKDGSSMWRSIALWLERPMSQFVRKYAEDGVLKGYFALCYQMDIAYAHLMGSPSFAAMLEQCPQIEGVKIYFADFDAMDKPYDGLYDSLEKIIMLDASERSVHSELGFLSHFVSTASHEYRHAFQDCARQRYHGPTLNYNDTHLLTLRGFIDEADANAFQCTVAYELKAEHNIDIFWDYYASRKPFIARAFLDEIEKDQDALWNGRAQQAAFLAFFENPSTLNFYTEHYMEHIQKKLKSDPRDYAKKIWKQQKAAEHMKLSPVKALPKPGQHFRTEAGTDNAQKQEGIMNFQDFDGAIYSRPHYGDDELFPATSVDYYLQKLGNKQYSQLHQMTEEVRRFNVRVDIELAKIKSHSHSFTP